jgi:signal peptidase I
MKLDILMHWLTAAIFAAFAGFGYLWYTGAVQGNFSALLMSICAVTGLYWLAERFYFLPKRKAAAETFAAELFAKNAALAKQGITKTDTVDVAAVQSQLVMQPWWLDWTAGLFPVIAVVFLLRSFLWEPFKIPSGSMIPTLYIGDLILVNKFTYGLKVPVFHQRLTQGNPVARGDVVVFRYPPAPHMDYIKRVIGLPGDEVSYINKQLKINGKPIAKQPMEKFFDPDTLAYFDQFQETIGAKPTRLLNYNSAPGVSPIFDDIPFKDNCNWSMEGVVCKVPAGHYFMMGDSRDNSQDSRYWGFVPEGNIVGKAQAIWMNFSHFDRIFTKVE